MPTFLELLTKCEGFFGKNNERIAGSYSRIIVSEINPERGISVPKRKLMQVRDASFKSPRDLQIEARSLLFKDEIKNIIDQLVIVANNPNLSAQDKVEESVRFSNTLFSSLFAATKDEIGAFLAEEIIKLPPEQIDQVFYTQSLNWEEAFKAKLAQKITNGVAVNNFTQLQKFFEVFLEAVLYSCYDEDSQLLSEEVRMDEFSKIRVSADLENCLAGDSADLERFVRSAEFKGSAYDEIENIFRSEISQHCYAGNHRHIPSWIRYVTTSDVGADENIYFVAKELKMYDLYHVIRSLMIGNVDIYAFALANVFTEMFLELTKRADDYVQGNFPQDWAQEQRESLHWNTKFYELFEVAKLASPYQEIKEFEASKLAEILEKGSLSFAEVTPANIALFGDFWKELSVEKETLSEEFLQESDDYSQICDLILRFNCYTSKNAAIPIWLRNQAMQIFGIPEPDENNYDFLTKEAEARIVAQLDQKAQEFNAKYNMNLHLLRAQFGEELVVKFCRDYEIDANNLYHTDLQLALDSGAEPERIALEVGIYKTQIERILAQQTLAEQRAFNPRNFNISGLLFHPKAREIIRIFETMEQDLCDSNPDNGVIRYYKFDLQAFYRGIFKTGDYNAFSYFPEEFREYVVSFLEGRSGVSNYIPLSSLKLLLYILEKIDDNLEVAQQNFTESICYLYIRPQGQSSRISVIMFQNLAEINEFLEWVLQEFNHRNVFNILTGPGFEIILKDAILNDYLSYDVVLKIFEMTNALTPNDVEAAYLNFLRIFQGFFVYTDFQTQLKSAMIIPLEVYSIKGDLDERRAISSYLLAKEHREPRFFDRADIDKASMYAIMAYNNGLKDIDFLSFLTDTLSQSFVLETAKRLTDSLIQDNKLEEARQYIHDQINNKIPEREKIVEDLKKMLPDFARYIIRASSERVISQHRLDEIESIMDNLVRMNNFQRSLPQNVKEILRANMVRELTAEEELQIEPFMESMTEYDNFLTSLPPRVKLIIERVGASSFTEEKREECRKILVGITKLQKSINDIRIFSHHRYEEISESVIEEQERAVQAKRAKLRENQNQESAAVTAQEQASGFDEEEDEDFVDVAVASFQALELQDAEIRRRQNLARFEQMIRQVNQEQGQNLSQYQENIAQYRDGARTP